MRRTGCIFAVAEAALVNGADPGTLSGISWAGAVLLTVHRVLIQPGNDGVTGAGTGRSARPSP